MFGNRAPSPVAVKKLSSPGSEDLQEKGLQLANFIIADRGVAVEILTNALSKLQVQRSREAKRSYWRSRHLKRKITRMVRKEGDMLQWLICSAAEPYEKQLERAGQSTEGEMVIRYIKYLVQVTTTMSSFYVNVGINRLLRNYSTPEVRQIYEWITEHFPSDQEYRKVKVALMAKLKSRFGDSLKARAGQYGELKFETSADQARWAELVQECLREFTPWSTDQACEALSSTGYHLSSLPKKLSGQACNREQDIIEVNRSHVFLHPECYSRVTDALGLDSGENRLSVPRFFMNGGDSSANGSEAMPKAMPKSEPLTEQQRRRIDERLSIESERRRHVKPKVLKILVDGVECARLVNGQGSKSQCQIEASANLIEIWTDYEGENLLLATHRIEYTRSHGIAAAAATVDLPNGRELFLKIAPQAQGDNASYAQLSLECRRASPIERIHELLTNRSLWLQRLPRYGLLSLLILGMGWSITRFRTNQDERSAIERLDKELAQEREARASVEKILTSQQAAVDAYLLAPDESREGRSRGGEAAGEQAIAFSPDATQVILELPTPRGVQTPYRAVLKSFSEGREILVENFAKPANALQAAHIEFVLPGSFVQAGKYYVVELNSTSNAGRSERVHIFTFYVTRK